MGQNSEAVAVAVTDLSDYRLKTQERAYPPPEPPAAGDAPLPTGTVTFLLTDIEGSTRAWESQGSRMAESVARHYEILDVAVARHAGVRPVEQGEGDSLVAVFARASDAVAAALDAQQALVEEDWPAEAEISVRMALHTGESQLRDERFYVGGSIIRCARLRSLAHGGQVLISSTTADLLHDGLPAGAALLPLGLHRLRDLRQPERVFQLAHPEICAHFPPLRSLDALPNNLPVQLTSFVGRDAELTEVASLLGDHRLVTLVGAGGCGKTRLAAQAAAEVAENYPDGAWWIDLGLVSDAERVPQATLSALGLLDTRGLDPVERIVRYLADDRTLLILDNCEHLLDPAARLLDRILRACPALTALATSREPLGVPGEVAWRVPALTLPADPDQSPAEVLLASEAVRLFVDRAVDARPAFRLDGTNAATVAGICVRLDGLPLAIELAAARVRNLSPERILAGLSDRFRLLTGGARTAVGRQQTLQASVEWSHALLGQSDQIVLRRLGAFAGSFNLEAAEEVCAGDGLESWEVLTLLTDLTDKSLVVFDGTRYRLLQTIHDFAKGRLLAADESDRVRDRHARFFLRLAEETSAQLNEAPRAEVLDGLEEDHDNLRAALQWALARDDHQTATSLIVALFLFWQIHGHYTEALGWYRQVLAAAPAVASPGRARALCGLGLLSGFGMEVSGGYGMAEVVESAALTAELDDPALAIRPRLHQAAFLGFMAPAQGVAALEALVSDARAAGDTWAWCLTLFWLAFHRSFHQDRPDLAAPALAELGEYAERSGGPYWQAWHAMAAAIAPVRQGHFEEARRLLEPALAKAGELGDPMLQAYCFLYLAHIPMARGDYGSVLMMAANCLETQQRIGSLCRVEWFDLQFAEALLAEGDTAGAQSRIERTAGAVRASQFPLCVHFLAILSGRLALAKGDLPAARSAFEEAEAMGAQLDCAWFLADSSNRRAALARLEGDGAAVEDLHHRALALCVRHGFRGVAAETLEALASQALAMESAAEAARLFGAAQALRQETGHRRWPADEEAYQADVVRLRGALGDDAACEQLWQEGEALSLEEAAAYASRARGERKRPSVGWAALTPTEVDVVALAAQGLTNAEIGRRLFIAPGTAKVHLSHIYTKLGVANRAELAAEATARGLRRTS